MHSRSREVVLLALTVLVLAPAARAEPPARDADRAVLEGVVVDEAGKPVPDVAVEAWLSPGVRWLILPVFSREPFDALFEAPPPFTADSPVRRVGRTDAEGRFRLEGLRDAEGFRIRARPEPPLRGRVEVLPVTSPGRGSLRLVVEEGRTVKGRLVDEEGHGLSGWISAFALPGRDRWMGPSYLSDSAVEEDLATDADGRFTFAAPKDARVRIDVFLPGRRHGMVQAFLGRDEDVTTLVVPSSGGATVSGHVRDEAGQPIPHARVMVHVPTSDGIGYRPSTTGLATTDADGAFSMAHLPAAELRQVSVAAPGFAIWNAVPFLTPLIEGDPLDIDVTLVRDARLVVRVVDEEGKGLPGAQVVLIGQMLPLLGQSWTRVVDADADGVARVDALPLGRGTLRVWAPGHYLPVEAMRHPLEDPLGRSFEAPEAGGTVELTAVMKKGPTLRGRVVDARGEAVSGASLGFGLNRSDAPRGNGYVRRYGTTHADGSFELGGLPPLTLLTVEVNHPEHPPISTEVDPSRVGDEDPLRIVLPEPARIDGRVLDPAGKPVAGVVVACGGTSETQVSDDEGRFTFSRVAPGRRSVHLGHVSSPATATYVDLTPGMHVPDLVLRHEGTGRGALEGVLLEADGRPGRGLAVEVRSLADANETGRAYADAEGRFRLERMPPGRYGVRADAATAEVTIPASGTVTTSLRLPARRPSFVVEGVVVDAEGKRVEFASLRIAYPGDGEHTTRGQSVVMGGRFRARVEGESGEVVVRVENARDARGRPLNHAPSPFTVAAPTADPVVVALQPALRLRGRVLETDGTPIANLPITLTRQVSDPGRGGSFRPPYLPPLQARTDEEGRFEVLGLDDHPYYVGIPSHHEWILPEPILVRPSDDEVEIRLARWQSLVTFVTAPDGSPVKGCRVEAYVLAPGGTRGGYTAITDEEGRAEHPRLKPHDELTLRILPPHPGEGLVADLLPGLREGVSPGGEPVRVQLGKGARVGGQVVDPTGTPISHVRVDLVIPRLSEESRPIQLPGLPPILPLRQDTQTDAMGTFSFRRLPPGESVSLFVQGPRDAEPSFFRETLTDIATGSEELLVVLQRAVSIDGVVPDLDPSALAGVTVRAHPLLKDQPNATFRFDGKTARFRLGGLKPGPYELHVRGGRNLVYEGVQTVEAPATGFVLRIATVHDLGGAVMGAGGVVFRAEFHIPGREPYKTDVGEDGLFRFHQLPDAEGTLLIHQPGDVRVAVVEDVYTGRQDPLVVELIEGSRITGRIVGQTKPLAGGRVIATCGTARFEGQVSEDGHFQTPALPPGEYELAFDFKYPKDGFVPSPDRVTAGTEDLVLEWATHP